jgi:hypothetical protein
MGIPEQQTCFSINNTGLLLCLLSLNIDTLHLFDKESFILQSDPAISTLKLLIHSDPGYPETYSVLTLTNSKF